MRKVGKKLVSMALAASMVLSMTACGSKNKETEAANTKAETTEAVKETEAAPKAEAKNQQADIVVIGAGGAGMSAAIQAVQDGATNVVVLEKMPIVGGNTIRATGGLNAAETQYQKAEGIDDSVELFVEDTMKGGKELNDKELVTTMAEQSNAALEWVNELGADLTVVGMFGGASVKRIHRPSDTSAVGPVLVKTLSNQLDELGVPVLLNTKAETLLVNENGAVSGVEVIDKNGNAMTIDCTSVVLATGGFGNNQDMVVEYKPNLAGFGTTNHAGATGDGIAMAKEIGAAFVDMDQIQTHPTVNPNTQTMYTEGVRGNGAILVNKEGKRFVDELETRDVVSEAILKQTDGVCYLLFDQAVRESLAAIEGYIKAGIVTEADTPEELGEALGIDGAALAETLTAYAGYQAAGKDDEFGRASMEVPLNQPKYYAALCAPAIHHTMGGVKINTSSEVLKEDGTAIGGLFAAGEVTGGVHGANRLGGNAVTDIVVFGRIAGSSAASYVEANGGHTESEIQVEKAETEAAPEVQGNYKDGVYEGTGKGNNGEIKVKVTVEGGNVVAVDLVEHGETDGIYQTAEDLVIAQIIKKQSAEVDTVSGATNSSKGIIEAVEQALSAAK